MQFLSLLGYSLINDDIETVTQIQLVIHVNVVYNKSYLCAMAKINTYAYFIALSFFFVTDIL